MSGAMRDYVGSGRRALLAVAATAEARAVLLGLGGDLGWANQAWRMFTLADPYDLVITGVGKSNAAGAVAAVLDPIRHAAVLNLGIAGLLPRGADAALTPGSVVLATACVFADEGLQTPGGFQTCAQMGFPPLPGAEMALPTDSRLRQTFSACASAEGPIATVSTCSGTDALAREVGRRTGALAEGMEGAAIALVAARRGVPMAELRVISNTTGDRSAQVWDLPGALARLGSVITRF
jgi:futalosine hydrolase